MNVLHIESRPSGRRQSEYEILVEVQCDNRRMEQLMPLLRMEVAAINLDTFEQGAELPPPTPLSATASFGQKCFCNSYNNIVDRRRPKCQSNDCFTRKREPNQARSKMK